MDGARVVAVVDGSVTYFNRLDGSQILKTQTENITAVYNSFDTNRYYAIGSGDGSVIVAAVNTYLSSPIHMAG